MKLWFFIIHFQECIPTRQMTVSDKINNKKTVSLTTQKKLSFLKHVLQQLDRITFNLFSFDI